MNDRITIDEEIVSNLRSHAVFDHSETRLVLAGRKYNPIKPVASGYKGVVWQVRDDYGSVLAAKFAIALDYEDRSFHQEVRLRRELPPGLFTHCYDADYWETPLIPNMRFVVTIEDWVHGQTLHSFLERPDNITSALLLHYGEAISRALEALDDAGLEHDDLHSKNVMLRRPRAGEATGYSDESGFPLQVTVVDTGSLKRRVDTRKSRSDVTNVAGHLVEIHNVLRRKRDLTVGDRRFLQEVLNIIRLMVDDDASRAHSATSIREELRAAYSRANQPTVGKSSLRSPFEYISAEQISNDELLLDLFTDTPWLGEVASPDPCLVTGPRGCGKSTMFRWLALRTHLHGASPVDLERLTIAGFYISCTTDIQNRFGWIRSPEQARKHEREIIHYFNLLLTREVILTLLAIDRRPDCVHIFGLGSREQDEVLRFLCKHTQQSSVALAGTSSLQQALDVLEKELFASHRRMLRGEPPMNPLPSTFIGDLTSLLVELMPIFDTHRIAFLLDDFSTHRVSEPVQHLLGPIIWERRSSHIFKVSSEKYGTVSEYQGGGSADLSRERIEIDCGKAYIDLSDQSRTAKNRTFATALLRNRLKAAGWAGSPEQLIGTSLRHADLVSSLRNKNERTPQYYGLSVIADLCSGDLATLLLVYRRILARANRTTITKVSPRAQHNAITEVSRELLTSISLHRPYGKEMHELAIAFGEFAGRSLREAKLISDGAKGMVPIEIPRIEVDQGEFARENLTKTLAQLARELVRRGIFVEMDIGRSRHEYVTTLRWHFRRIYMPAFRAGLHKNDAVKLNPSMFRWLLQDPRNVLDAQFRQRSEAGNVPPITLGQEKLDFSEDGA